MKNTLAIILLTILLLVIEYSSEAQDTISQNSAFSLGAQIGVGIPIDYFENIANNGYGIQGLFSIALSPSLDLRLTVGSFSFGEIKRNGIFYKTSTTDIAVLIGFSYKFTTNGLIPYIGAEVGMHKISSKTDAKYSNGQKFSIPSSPNKTAVGVFGGLLCPISRKLLIMWEGRFNYLSVSPTYTITSINASDELKLISIHTGLVYNF